MRLFSATTPSPAFWKTKGHWMEDKVPKSQVQKFKVQGVRDLCFVSTCLILFARTCKGGMCETDSCSGLNTDCELQMTRNAGRSESIELQQGLHAIQADESMETNENHEWDAISCRLSDFERSGDPTTRLFVVFTQVMFFILVSWVSKALHHIEKSKAQLDRKVPKGSERYFYYLI